MTACVPGALRFVHVIEELLRGGHPVRFCAPGWSMHPTIRNGELITVTPLGLTPIRVGDVVLYRRGRATIAHRVIRLQPGAGRPVGYLLRGDAASCCDRPVELAQVLGRVLAVERGRRTKRLDFFGPIWSRALGRTLRAARDFRTKAARIVTACPIKLYRVT